MRFRYFPIARSESKLSNLNVAPGRNVRELRCEVLRAMQGIFEPLPGFRRVSMNPIELRESRLHGELIPGKSDLAPGSLGFSVIAEIEKRVAQKLQGIGPVLHKPAQLFGAPLCLGEAMRREFDARAQRKSSLIKSRVRDLERFLHRVRRL